MAVRSLSVILATACLALMAPAVASADVSSLDAYAGQAAVLGKPHHRHHRHGHSTAAARGRKGRPGVTLGGRPSGPTSGSHRSTTGRGSGAAVANTSGTPNGTRSGGPAPSTDGVSAGGGGSNTGSSAARSGPGASSQGGESAVARGVRNAVPAASASSALTTADIVVLFVVALTVLGTAFAIRALSRQPR